MTAVPPAPPGFSTEDFFTDGFFRDPHPFYDVLRARAPATRVLGTDGRRIWLVCGYEEARTVLTHPGVRKEEWRRPDLGARRPARRDGWREVDPRIRQSMINAEPPEHQRLRHGAQQAFSPARCQALRPRLAEIADAHLEAFAALGPGPLDLRGALAHPFATAVITELLGLHEDERAGFRAWFRTLMDHRDTESVRTLSESIAGYTEGVVDRRTARPAGDLISALAAGSAGLAPLTRSELASTVFLLLVAGVEGANVLGNGVLALLRHPEQLAALRADPALLPGAVEEVLRYDGSFRTAGPRYTTRPVQLGELTIPEGEFLLPVLQAANRDPRRFPDPHRFDLTRTDHQHLGMGYGAHRCVGARIAHAQLETVLGKLLERFPALRLAGPAEDIVRRQSMTMNWLEALPVVLW